MTEAQLAKYKCDGQMSIFDLYEEPHKPPCDKCKGCDGVSRKIDKDGICDSFWPKSDRYNFRRTIGQTVYFCTPGSGTNPEPLRITEIKSYYTIAVDTKGEEWALTPTTISQNLPEDFYCDKSKHKCNRKNLWEVADTLDYIECEHTCCRKCKARMGCGARCNGADDVKCHKMR